MKPQPQTRIALAAPYVCGALLVSLLVVGGISARRPLGLRDYNARVRTAIEDIPYMIGPTVGLDGEPTPAAVQLLSPNKIMERRYVDYSTGTGFSLMIVHCGDVRDMVGHYPPVCYKAHGWTQTGSQTVALQIGSDRASGTSYHFVRKDDLTEHGMTVLDFFVLPEEGRTIFDDMGPVEKASRSSELGGLGVAQIQIVVGDEADPQWREKVVHETLQAIAPAVRTISQGINK